MPVLASRVRTRKKPTKLLPGKKGGSKRKLRESKQPVTESKSHEDVISYQRVVFDLMFKLNVMWFSSVLGGVKADLMLKSKIFHFDGIDAKGAGVFVECSKSSDVTVVRLEPAQPSQPLRFGQRLCHIRPVDEQHVEIEEVTGGGPPMVSSQSYRAGWDRVFGLNGIN